MLRFSYPRYHYCEAAFCFEPNRKWETIPSQSFISLHIMSIGYASGGSAVAAAAEIPFAVPAIGFPHSFGERSHDVGTTRRRRRARRGAHGERHMRRTSPGDSWAWRSWVDAASRRAHNSGQSAYVHTCERTYAKRTRARVRNTDREIWTPKGSRNLFEVSRDPVSAAKWSDFSFRAKFMLTSREIAFRFSKNFSGSGWIISTRGIDILPMWNYSVCE